MADRSTPTGVVAAVVTILVGLAALGGWLSGTAARHEAQPNPVHTIPDRELLDNADELRQELLDDGFQGILGGSPTYVYVKFDQPPENET